MEDSKRRQSMNSLHYDYSSKFPPAIVLHLQGSAALILRKRCSNLNSPESYVQPLLSPAILTNATEVLTLAPTLTKLFLDDIDRNSPDKLRIQYPQPLREQKGIYSNVVDVLAWKKELQFVERKVSAYRILRKKALDGNIQEVELAMLIRKALERRVKSKRKPTKFQLEKLPGPLYSCNTASPLSASCTPSIKPKFRVPIHVAEILPLPISQEEPSPCNLPPPAFTSFIYNTPIFYGNEPDGDYSLPLDGCQEPPAIFSTRGSVGKVHDLDELVDKIMKGAGVDEEKDESVRLIEYEKPKMNKITKVDLRPVEKVHVSTRRPTLFGSFLSFISR
jgi:hypothetical protein